MTALVLGNIIALIAASMQFIVGIIKNRKKALYVQTVQYGVFAVSSFILGGFSGTIANIMCNYYNNFSCHNINTIF